MDKIKISDINLSLLEKCKIQGQKAQYIKMVK